MAEVNPVAGAIFGADSYQDETALQVGGAVPQIQSITIGGTPANTNVLTVNLGEDAGSLVTASVTLTAVTAASTTTAAAALVEAINAKIGISNLVFASNPAGATIMVTGRQKGASKTFSMTGSATGGGATLTVNAISITAADATVIPFGVMTERSSATKVSGVSFVGSAIGTGTYTAQVSTITAEGGDITLATGDVLYATITGDLDGSGVKSFSAQTVFRTNAATTLTAFVAALNGVLPANSVLAAVSSNDITFTGEVAGLSFSVSASYDDAGGTPGSFTVAATTPNAIPFGGGVSLKSHTIEQDANGDSEYGMGDTFSGLTEGKCYVLVDSGVTIAEGEACFVRVTAVSPEQAGAFTNVSDGGDNLPIGSFGFKGIWLGGNITDMNGQNVAPLYLTRA
jgi:hypothetical protein